MNYILQMVVIVFLLVSGCVGPPSYEDGLLENIPAVVNETDYFSLSILGDEYSEKKEWDLLFTPNPEDLLLTTFVTKDINITPSDSTTLYLINDLNDTVFYATLLNEFVFTSFDSITFIGNPKKVVIEANNFSGRLEYQIIIN